jgi:hypothetical protein
MGRCCLSLLILLAVVAPATTLRADDAGIEFFEKQVRPILVQYCYECHSENAKKLGGGLLLDSRDGVNKGGDSGPAIESGKPDESLLIEAVRYGGAVKMPPKGKLPAAAIANLEEWVRRGVPDPRTKGIPGTVGASWEQTLKSRRDWWSLRALSHPEVPQAKQATGSAQPIDGFILSSLEQRGLLPADPAGDNAFVRRLCLVLTGLPPTPLQIAEFVEQAASDQGKPAALERLVDSLLSSPQFGERWARHWMDVVRFTETHGNEWNYEVHHAWRYRDYLIRAFNADVPYDQFVREHIAGDLLAHARWNEQENFNESVIGTAFYRFGEVNHDDCISLREIGFDLADNQIDTLTKAFQATTVACARCHDHKLDAISSRDYYALLGVLRSSRMVSHTLDGPQVNATKMRALHELKPALRKELALLWRDDLPQLGRYMLAAQAKRANRADADDLAADLNPQRLEKWVAALAVEKAPLEDPLEPWRRLFSAAGNEPARLPDEWHKLADEYQAQDRERSDFNQTQFSIYADFREAVPNDWQVGGQGLFSGPSRSGEFTLHAEGDAIVKGVLPAGTFSHRLSEKLNGTLRSPVLPVGRKNISFQVMGQRSSALRLVSNNCQLNYKNYRALTFPELQWVTFSPPDDRDSLRTYAELLTMFDNPKFPDQLSALGKDTANYKVPWDKAAENPRSYFGITQAVLHDGPDPPKAELSHLRVLLAGAEPSSFENVAGRYAAAIERALEAWSDDRASDDDALWLDNLLRRDLLSNRLTAAPRLQSPVEQYRRLEGKLSLPRIAPGIADGGDGYEQPLFIRGDCQRPGDKVTRRYLEVLSTGDTNFSTAGSGRLELAERIASPQNPLTARVMVNRIWQYLFGTGLVRTVDDFGHVGDLPSHPELLDWLAGKFMADGWSVKRLIRDIVLSQTFQRASQPSTAAREADPLNRLLSHYPARRLEAEAIRDLILAASGRLDRQLYGMSVQPYREKEYADRRLFPGPLDGNGRRSVYIKNNLMESPKFLGVFNFPGGKVAQGKRDITNVPAQALALLNDPFVWQQADVWAARLIERPDSAMAQRIDAMFETALGRLPSDAERQRFVHTALKLAELHQVPSGDVLKSQIVWKELAHAMFNLKEFIYVP